MTKVLLIEDDISIQELIRFHLEKEQYQVLLAQDGNTGLEVMEENETGVLFTRPAKKETDDYISGRFG